ncbi:MAG: hypothetical protein KTR20_12515 [Cellvibrionaceae bacterium]|nr:hypothetical protein [Cellvibrionaceae bacterium]
MKTLCGCCLLWLVISGQAQAGEADVIDVKIRHNGGDSFQIIATVKHADTGWKHYANAWQVLNENGEVIGTRTLHHPHENEQPFSRSLTLTIAPEVKKITVRALDSVHGAGGKTLTRALSR